jgi:hypothetical protein
MRVAALIYATLLVGVCSLANAQTPALVKKSTDKPTVDPRLVNVPVTLEIRVVALDRTRIRQFGFDWSLPNFDTQIGGALLGFLPALQREGLVPHDSVVSETVHTGQNREFFVPWPNSAATGADDKWQRLSMRFDARLVTPDTLDLQVWCAAAHTGDLHAAPDFEQKLTLGIRNRRQGEPFLVSTTVRPVDKAGVPKQQIDVIAIVTPRWELPGEKQSAAPPSRYSDGIVFDTIAIRR